MTFFEQQSEILASQLFWVVIFLLVAIFLFVRNKIRMDVVALLVMLVFSLSGILTTQEVLAGFSDPNIILIALLFVVGEGLVRTGIAYQVSEWLIKASKNSEAKVLILLMLAVAGLGAFMSSTGIVAIFIPVVMVICRQMNISPKRLMMPLSIAGLISGMMTLIATAPNLVVNSELVRASGERFSFFSFTPIGVVILLIGILYMLIARRWLDNTGETYAENSDRHSLKELIEEYDLSSRTKRFVVRQGSDFIGQPIEELHLRSNYGLNVLAIERWKRFRPVFLAASLGKAEVKEKDILLIDISNLEFDQEAFCQAHQLEPAEIRSYDFNQQVKSIGMVEVTPIPDSDYLGRTIA